MRHHAKASEKATGREGGQAQPLRFLGYALPQPGMGQHLQHGDGFDLLDEPLGSQLSFLDFDGVVVFAGPVEKSPESPLAAKPAIVTFASAVLDRREREFSTGVERGKTFIFLLSSTIQSWGVHDLVGRAATRVGVGIAPYPRCGCVTSLVPEFREFTDHFGTGYNELLDITGSARGIRPICSDGRTIFGIVLLQSVYFLPCTAPRRTTKPWGWRWKPSRRSLPIASGCRWRCRSGPPISLSPKNRHCGAGH